MSIVHRYHLQVSILLSIFLILSIATGMPRTARAAARASVTQPSAAEPARINYLTAGDLSITKSADPVPAGEILTYEVTVYNNSSDVITDTVVTDTLPLELNYQADSWGCSLVSTAPDILSCALGDLPAGGSRSFEILAETPADAVATESDGRITVHNTVTTTSAVTDTNPGNNSFTESTFVTEEADLQVTALGDPPATVAAGELFTYTLVVDNFGPSFARDAVLTNTLLSSGAFTLLSVTDDPARTGDSCVSSPTPGGSLIVCTLGSPLETAGYAPSNGRWEIQVQVRADEAQEVSTEVEVQSATPDPDPSNNTALDFTSVTAVTDLRATASAAGTATAGQTTTFQITAHNDGPSTAQNVELVNELPPGVTLTSPPAPCTLSGGGTSVTCPVGALIAGGQQAFNLNVAVDPDLAAGATLNNSVTVSGADFDDDNTNNTASTATSVLSTASLSVVKSSTPATVAAGETLDYSITITNSGPSTAHDVFAFDNLPAEVEVVSTGVLRGVNGTPAGSGGTCQVLAAPDPLTCQLGAMPAGEALLITIRVRVAADAVPTSDPNGSITIANQVTVSASNATDAVANATTTVNRSSDIGIVKTGTPLSVYAGEEVYYTLEVTNDGPSDAARVIVTDTLPSGLIYQADTGGCSPTLGQLVCALGDLPVGDTISFQILADVPADAVATDADGRITVSNTAIVNADGADTNPGNNSAVESTLITEEADLQVTALGDPPATVKAGERFTYTLVVDNLGPSFARNTVLTNTLYASGLFTVTDDPARSDDSCSTTPLAGGIRITCDLTNPLGNSLETAGYAPSNGRWEIQVQVRADEAQEVSTEVEVQSATPDPDSSNNSALDFTSVTAVADLRATASAAGTATAGQTTTFQITAHNDGPSTAQNVVLVNNLPLGVTLPSPAPCTLSGGGTSVTCPVGELIPGGQQTFNLNVAVDPDLAAGETLNNSVTVSGDDFDDDNTNNYASTSTSVLSTASLSVAKSSTPAAVAAGETIDYSITITNSGPSSAHDVFAFDNLPASVEVVSTGVLRGVNGTPAGRGGTCQVLAAPDPLTCQLGAMPVGEALLITLRVQAAADAVPASDSDGSIVITNEVTVSASNATDAVTDATTTVNRSSDVEVVKSVEPAIAYAGEQVRYTLDVTNEGPSDAADVVLIDTLPAELTYQTNTGGCTLVSTAPEVLECALGVIPVSSSRTIEIYARVHADVISGSVALNEALVTTAPTDPDGTNNSDSASTELLGLADLRITEYGHVSGEVQAGDLLTYTIIVDNLGPGTAHDVVMDKSLESNSTFDLLSVSSDRPATCSPSSGSFSLLNLRCELTDPLEVMASGNTGRWTIQVVVQATEAQDLTAESQVFGSDEDPDLSNNHTTVQHEITESADLMVDKTALGKVQVDGQRGGTIILLPDRATAGTELTYTLTLTNAGPSTAKNVVLQDRLPGWIVVDSVSPSQGSCNVGIPGDPDAPLTCGLGTMGPNQTVTVIVVVDVEPETPGGTPLNNDVLVYSDAYDPDNSDNFVTQRTTVDSWTDLTVTKSAAPALALPGNVITYTITVHNRGPSDAVDALVQDPIPDGLINTSWTCSATPGAECTAQGTGSIADVVNLPAGGTLVYKLGGTVNTAGAIINTATVTVSMRADDPYPIDNSDSVANRPEASYLPLILSTRYSSGPDLVVEELIVGNYSVQVVIRNRGNEPVTAGFWVDAYIDPSPAPRGVNQVWNDLSVEGMVWGVSSVAMPLQPDEIMVLSLNGDYYWPSLSRVTWPLPAGTPVYAQVDSYAPDTDYGLVLEGHEVGGSGYNNVAGPVFSPFTTMGAAAPQTTSASRWSPRYRPALR